MSETAWGRLYEKPDETEAAPSRDGVGRETDEGGLDDKSGRNW